MRILKGALVVALLFILGCGGSTALRSGKVYYEKNKDYPRAEEWLKKAVEQEPQNWEAHFYLALALAQQEKYAEAEKSFAEAYRLADADKKDVVYSNQHSFFVKNYNKGITANSNFNYAEAVDYFKKAVAVEPSYAKGHVNLGVAYSMLDDEASALKAFQEAVKADSTEVEAWRNLGITYQRMGEYAKAREAYQKLVELAPDDADGLFSLGDMYYNEQNYQKALEYYRKTAEIKGEDAGLEYQIGTSCFSLSQYDEAAKAFTKAAALAADSDPQLYRDAMYNLAMTYVKTEQYDMAASTLQKLLEIEDSADLHEALGRVYSRMGLTDKALEEFRRAEELSGK